MRKMILEHEHEYGGHSDLCDCGKTRPAGLAYYLILTLLALPFIFAWIYMLSHLTGW